MNGAYQHAIWNDDITASTTYLADSLAVFTLGSALDCRCLLLETDMDILARLLQRRNYTKPLGWDCCEMQKCSVRLCETNSK